MKILNFLKKKRKQTAEKEKDRKNQKKRDWAGPTGTLGGAAPGPHRPGWCIAPPQPASCRNCLVGTVGHHLRFPGQVHFYSGSLSAQNPHPQKEKQIICPELSEKTFSPEFAHQSSLRLHVIL
jgi:hypothetical protein